MSGHVFIFYIHIHPLPILYDRQDCNNGMELRETDGLAVLVDGLHVRDCREHVVEAGRVEAVQIGRASCRERV